MDYYYNDKVGIEVRSSSEMTENEKALLGYSQLSSLASVEVWSAVGTNQQMAYSTHGAFRYFGKFPPPIATHLILSYTQKGDCVFDPMSGSGTTGVEALLQNRNSILNDISPLSSLLSRVKTTFISRGELEKVARNIYKEYKPLSFQEYPFEPSNLKNYEHWFLPETVDSLRGLKYIIELLPEGSIRDFFTLCFAGVVRRVSKATTQQGRLFLDVETAEKDALPFFKKRVDTAIAGVSTLPYNNSTTKIISYDLRSKLPDSLNDVADLVICHPPYFNSYKYSSINSLELAWLDVAYSNLRKNEVREFFKVGKEENAEYYVDDMEKVLTNLYPTLKSNGILGLMIGDTMIHGNYIPVTKMLLERISRLYNIELVALRAPKYTEAAWVASQRRTSSKVGITLYDFVVVMRRKP